VSRITPPSDSEEVLCVSTCRDRLPKDSSRAQISARGPVYGGWCGTAFIFLARCLLLILIVSRCGYLVSVSAASTNPVAAVNPTNASATAPQWTISPMYLSFGNVATGQSVTLPVTLTSTGTAALKIDSASISGSGFSFSGSLPVTLSPKQTVTLHVKFAPTVTGSQRGTLTIRSNATPNPTIYLNMIGTGTGSTAPQWAISPVYLSFGDIVTGKSATLPVTLTSTGTAALTIDSARMSGTGFSVSGAVLPVTLNPKQTVTLQVKFAPTAVGAAKGTLTILSNASTKPAIYLNMIGTGSSTPQWTVSPTSLSFGDVTVGSSATLPVKLTSSGTAALTISSASISGTGFSMSGATFPVTLNPGQAITLSVKFSPTAAISSTGTITVNSNSSTNAKETVGLSGIGVQHQVDLNWQAPSSSPVPVTGYKIYRATGSSSSFQLLNSSVDATTSYVDITVVAGTSYTYYVESVDSSGTTSGPSNEVTVTIP